MAVTEELYLTNNWSSRYGVKPIKFGLHTTQGWVDDPNGAVSCAKYFQGDVGVSAHYMNDNFHPYHVVAGVYEQNAAWTQSGKNGDTISLEQCAMAEWLRDYWLNHRGILLQTTAALVRQVCDANQIPIRALTASEAQDSWTPGVCQHDDFGSAGGGHWDCGDGYPMDKIIEWAKASSGSAPVTEEYMSSSSVDRIDGTTVYACVWKDGKFNVKFGDNGVWIACDKTQSPVKSGAHIANKSDGGLRVTGTNGSGDVIAYEQGPGDKNEDWRWKSLKGDAK